jgi:cytidine deaminase
MTEVNDKLERLLIEGRFPGDTSIDSISIGYYRTQLADFVLHLLIETAARQPKAVSYRSFNVAAGAYALKPGPLGHIIERGMGVNVKVDDTDTINIHAEDLAVGKAAARGCDAVSVLTVIGPTQEDHVSGKHTSTLHPCGRCRGRLSNNALIRDDTLVVTAREDFSMIDVSDINGIKLLHDEGDDCGVRSFKLTQSQKLFTPVDVPETGVIVLGDKYEVDSSEWDETIGMYLLHRYNWLTSHESDSDSVNHEP